MDYIQWEIRMPFYKNRMIMRGLLAAAVIPVVTGAGFLLLFRDTLSSESDLIYAAGLIGLFYMLVIGLIFDRSIRRFAPGYIVDRDGIINYTVPGIRKRLTKRSSRHQTINHERSISSIRLIPKLLFRSSDLMDVGLHAQTHQISNIRWKDIKKVKYSPKHKMITVKSLTGEIIFIFCEEINYEAVSHLVFKNTNQSIR